MRRALIAGNWKMNGSKAQALELLSVLQVGTADLTMMDWLVCPSFPYLSESAHILSESSVQLGAQDVSAQQFGAYTGEVSGEMLCDVGCSYVIVGHSERRHQGESNGLIANKTAAALSVGLKPVVCVGETLSQRESGQTLSVVHDQLEVILNLQDNSSVLLPIVIAYEPVWAIGTGLQASSEQVQHVHAAIRHQLSAKDPVLADEVRVIYGGSVKPDNVASFVQLADVDGVLVGGASLDVSQFLEIGRQWNN